MSLLDRLAACAVVTPSAYRPLRIGGQIYGRVRHHIADRLADFSDVFAVTDGGIDVRPSLADAPARTAALAGVLEALRAEGLIKGWRGEKYPVSSHYHAPAVMTIERAAVPLLGTKGYGVHLNGFVRRADGLHMWIGKRAMTKPTGPGKLDQMVAGGQPVGISVRDNLIKECAEEAGIDASLAARAVPVGTVSYLTERDEGLRDDVLFNYDLEVPDDFEPRPTDGEVDAFYLLPMPKILQRLRDGDTFKFNAALVIIDFAVRHGVIDPADADYVPITEALRRGRPDPFAAG